MPEPSPTLTCAHGCVLRDDEPLYDIGGEQFHAIVTREAVSYGYFGPEPEESEPCGPVVIAPARTPSATADNGEPRP